MKTKLFYYCIEKGYIHSVYPIRDINGYSIEDLKYIISINENH